MQVKAVYIYLVMQVVSLIALGQTSHKEVAVCFDNQPLYLTAHSDNATYYQWLKNNDEIPGATFATLQVFDTGFYSVLAYNNDSSCPSDTSERVRVILKALKAIDDQYATQVSIPLALEVYKNDQPGCYPLNYQSILIKEHPKYGVLRMMENGVIVYTPSWEADDTDYFVYTISDTAGMVSNAARVDINIQKECAVIYPNPFTNMIHLNLQHKSINRLRLADLSGQILLTDEITTPSKTLQLIDYASGMYILQLLEGDNIRCVYKIIKKD